MTGSQVEVVVMYLDCKLYPECFVESNAGKFARAIVNLGDQF